jgi:hypothetical protein
MPREHRQHGRSGRTIAVDGDPLAMNCSVTLDVPQLDEGLKSYRDALGLVEVAERPPIEESECEQVTRPGPFG